MAESRKHVFISHVHEDDHRLAPLRDLLQRAGMEICGFGLGQGLLLTFHVPIYPPFTCISLGARHAVLSFPLLSFP